MAKIPSFFFTRLFFITGEIHREKKRSLRKFIIGKSVSFIYSEILGTPNTIFIIMYAKFHKTYFRFWLCIEAESIKRDFQTRKEIVLFFNLVNECSFGTNVFMIIEICSKKWWKKKLGRVFCIEIEKKNHCFNLFTLKLFHKLNGSFYFMCKNDETIKIIFWFFLSSKNVGLNNRNFILHLM